MSVSVLHLSGRRRRRSRARLGPMDESRTTTEGRFDEYQRSTNPAVDHAACRGSVRARLPAVSGLLAAAVADADARGGRRVLPGQQHRDPRRRDPRQPDCGLARSAIRGHRSTDIPHRTSSSVFTYAYIICVGIGTTAFILADYCWGVAAFRPDRDPQLISSAERHGVVLLHRAGRHDRRAEPPASR